LTALVTAPVDAPKLPARAALREDGLHVALAGIAPAELHDPFLQDTLRRIPTQLTLLHVPSPQASPAQAGSAPAGLIYHVSRCGSTLTSQLLKLQPGLAVYSEPPALNELLAPPHPASRARLVGSLRALGHLFSKHAGGPYVLKLSSWNLLFCDALAEAFPQTPWALCLRDPIEVCVSLAARPPGWFKNPSGPLQPYLGAGGDGKPASAARVFASFCAAAERLDASQGLLLHYDRLPDAVWEQALARFGMQAEPLIVERMRAASRHDAKAPVGQPRPFTQDAALKRQAAPAELRGEVEALARPALDRLIRRMGG